MDLQKATLSKRAAALVLDLILLSVLAVGFVFGLFALLEYDSYSQVMKDAYATYEEQYGITLNIGLEEYGALPQAQKQLYDTAYEALSKDEAAVHAYNMMLNISLLSTTLGILFAILVLEFMIPLWLGNGQTVGKKVFGLGLVRRDSVKINPGQVFIRALLGKYTIETMVPVYLLLMMFWGILDITGTVILCGLGLLQVVLYAVTDTNAQIHDLLASTVVVDITSQRIFASSEDLLAHIQRQHADRAAQQDY